MEAKLTSAIIKLEFRNKDSEKVKIIQTFANDDNESIPCNHITITYDKALSIEKATIEKSDQIVENMLSLLEVLEYDEAMLLIKNGNTFKLKMTKQDWSTKLEKK